MGEVGDASVFRVWGSRAFVRDTSANKLSARAIPCVFLGFPHDAPGLQFYHPTSRHVVPSHDVMFEGSIPFYHLFPYRSAPPPPPPLFLALGPPPVDPLPPQGPAPSRVSQVDPLLGTVPVEVAVDSGATRGAASRGAEPGGAESSGAEPVGVEPGGAESGNAESRGTASSEGRASASPRLSPWPEPLSLQLLREWFTQRTRLRSGAAGARDSATGDTRAGGAGVTAGAGGTGGDAAAGPGGGARARAGGAGDTGAGGAGALGVGAGGAGARGAVSGGTGAGGTMRPRPYFIPLLQQPASPLPAPSPYAEQTGGLIERREPASRPASPVCMARRVPRPRPHPVPSTHAMALQPSCVQLRVPLSPPPASSLPTSTVASALVAELVDFAAACRLDYATALVT
ncbi:unnamed protein product [Closterium sp. NIES-53]